MYLAPLEQLKPVIKDKESRYIDINIIASSLLNTMIWTLLGILTNNYIVITPNATGFTLSMLMLVVYFWAKNQNPLLIPK